MSQLYVRKSIRHDENPVQVGPGRRLRSDSEMRREVERPRRRWDLVGIVPRSRGVPFQPMFRWLADASTPEPAPKAVELSRFRSYRRIRSSILIGLLDGTIIARLGQLDFHTTFALEWLGV